MSHQGETETKQLTKQFKDRRINKTITSLHTALLDLIKTKSYDSISIKDIVKHANVGRSTFYTHFYDKHSLLMSGFEEHIIQVHAQQRRELEDCGKEQSVFAIPSLYLFEHTGNNIELYRALAGSQGTRIFMQRLEEILIKIIREQMQRSQRDTLSLTMKNFLPVYVAKTFITTLSWWLETNKPCSLREIDTIYQSLIQSITEQW